jgi:hypothetical protein
MAMVDSTTDQVLTVALTRRITTSRTYALAATAVAFASQASSNEIKEGNAMSRRDVRVRGERRENIDIQRFATALISLAASNREASDSDAEHQATEAPVEETTPEIHADDQSGDTS